jgi:hypothetical protein
VMVTSGGIRGCCVGRRRSHFDRAEASRHSLEAVIREELELLGRSGMGRWCWCQVWRKLCQSRTDVGKTARVSLIGAVCGHGVGDRKVSSWWSRWE